MLAADIHTSLVSLFMKGDGSCRNGLNNKFYTLFRVFISFSYFVDTRLHKIALDENRVYEYNMQSKYALKWMKSRAPYVFFQSVLTRLSKSYEWKSIFNFYRLLQLMNTLRRFWMLRRYNKKRQNICTWRNKGVWMVHSVGMFSGFVMYARQ